MSSKPVSLMGLLMIPLRPYSHLMGSTGWCWPPLLSSRQGTAPGRRHSGRREAWSAHLHSRWASLPRSPAACRCGCAGSGRPVPPAGRCARHWAGARPAAGSMTVRSCPPYTSCPFPSWGWSRTLPVKAMWVRCETRLWLFISTQFQFF